MVSENAGASGHIPQQTPLYDAHKALGARMVEFGGWMMPVQYSSIIEEHQAVRTAAGLFDVSHMGEFLVDGTGALDFLESMVPNHVARLKPGQAQYTQICNEHGGTVDDLLIYYLSPEHYMVVVNAGTMEHDWQWFSLHAAGHADATLTNVSMQTALIALQGPRAQEILAQLTDVDVASIAYYHFAAGIVAGIPCRISRTGYTGEDGFELYHAAESATALWQTLLDAGKPAGLLPAGLGARDTLRLEAGYCLYGHELTEDISPLEADLAWSVRLQKPHDFIGKDALVRQKTDGLARKRIGFIIRDRAIARAGAAILANGVNIGEVTSGTKSISLDTPLGLGYVPPEYAQAGTSIAIEIRGQPVMAEVVKLPFYTRAQ